MSMLSEQIPSDDIDPPARPTILVVEDEVLVRMSVANYLRDCGYRVIEAGDGDEALAILESDTRIDILFTDVQMPGKVDGFGLARWVRRERRGVKVILTSGVTRTSEAAGDLCEEGPMLAKPYDHSDLERRIRLLLANR
jgi:CheY-like chemotaxis protein